MIFIMVNSGASNNDLGGRVEGGYIVRRLDTEMEVSMRFSEPERPWAVVSRERSEGTILRASKAHSLPMLHPTAVLSIILMVGGALVERRELA